MREGIAGQGALLAVPAPAEREVEGHGVAEPVARVVLETPVPHLDRTFDYLVAPELDAAAAVGTRVTVRFGAQESHGWVWERARTTTHLGPLAPVQRVHSDLPVLTPATMALVEAVAVRCAGTRSDVVRLAVPPRHASTERSEREAPGPALPTWDAPEAAAEAPGTGTARAEAPGWEAYDGGPAFLGELAGGGAPRAAWCALPAVPGVTSPWTRLLAAAARTALSSGRGVLVVVATTGHAEKVAEALRSALPGEPVGVLCAEHGPARRYRVFTRILLGRCRVVVGTRSAAFAPVADLGLALIWDDGDNRLDERHAPYVHARTVLALRSGLEGCALLVAGYSRSVEAQAYVEQGWARELRAPRPVLRAAAPRVEVPGAPELEAEGASGAARIPSLAHRMVRRALAAGPVLIQVPRSGYAPVLACARCRTAARCQTCGGPLSLGRSGGISCRWCARGVAAWSCPECGATSLRMASVGAVRTGEELGRAFPGVPVVVSGARADHGVVATVDDSPRLVVATPGAEPHAEGGYRAVLIVDASALSTRPELGASSEALRLWTNAAALARHSARVMVLGGAEPVAAQALVRWDHPGFARRQLAERAELHLPPAWRTARLDGASQAVESALEEARRAGFETLGPVPAPAVPGPEGQGAGAQTMDRALVRAPLARGRELAAMLRLRLRERSVRREEQVRIELDPTVLW